MSKRSVVRGVNLSEFFRTMALTTVGRIIPQLIENQTFSNDMRLYLFKSKCIQKFVGNEKNRKTKIRQKKKRKEVSRVRLLVASFV